MYALNPANKNTSAKILHYFKTYQIIEYVHIYPVLNITPSVTLGANDLDLLPYWRSSGGSVLKSAPCITPFVTVSLHRYRLVALG
ncbi:cAMP-dependent protein kinase type 2 [Fusarium oxysporum f. sp. albedinis]|nr:cAMP-dependent protein kinase type 2 [Fusarium oxysporum f. sp. albedinis]